MRCVRSGGWASVRSAAWFLLKVVPVALLIPACTGQNKNNTPPPLFNGVQTVGNVGAGNLTAILGWGVATDLSGQGIAQFNVFASLTPGNETLLTSVPGTDTTGANVSVPSAGTWYFIVQAQDGAGNTDGNAHEVSGLVN